MSVANAQARTSTAENTGCDFDARRTAADTAWNAMLNRVQVTGGAAADLQKFYTALYHVFQSPNIASDVNGQYRGFDNAVHTASGMTVYQNYSGWDIYRSWAALVALIAPDVMTDIVKSMVLDGQQGGLLPKWSQQSTEDFVMTGDPGPIIVASACTRSACASFDTAAALSLMEKSSNGGTTQGIADPRQPGRRTRQPALHRRGPVRLAGVLGLGLRGRAVRQGARQHRDGVQHLHDPRAVLAQRLQPRVRLHQPRNSDGSWSCGRSTRRAAPATPRATPSQYTWMVTVRLRRPDQPDGRAGRPPASGSTTTSPRSTAA